MTLEERNMDLFTVDDEYYLAHCISSDCALAAGIAVEFEKRFNLRAQLKGCNTRFPTVVLIGRVFNLVTKAKYFQKPKYLDLLGCLYRMHDMCLEHGVKKLAMPMIGCGLDGLTWHRVKSLIYDVFQDTDIDILICYLVKPQKG